MSLQETLRDCGVTDFTVKGRVITINAMSSFSTNLTGRKILTKNADGFSENIEGLEKLKYKLVFANSCPRLLRNLVKARNIKTFISGNVYFKKLVCLEKFAVSSNKNNLQIESLKTGDCVLGNTQVNNSTIEATRVAILAKCDISSSDIYAKDVIFENSILKGCGYGGDRGNWGNCGNSGSTVRDVSVYAKNSYVDVGISTNNLHFHSCDTVGYFGSDYNTIKLSNCKSLFTNHLTNAVMKFNHLDELYIVINPYHSDFSDIQVSDEEFLSVIKTRTQRFGNKFIGPVKNLYLTAGYMRLKKEVVAEAFDYIRFKNLEVLNDSSWSARISKFIKPKDYKGLMKPIINPAKV